MAIAIHCIQALTVAADIALLALILQQRTSLLRGAFALHVGFGAAWACSVFFVVLYGNPALMQAVFAFAGLALTAQLAFVMLFAGKARLRHVAAAAAIGVAFSAASFAKGAVFSSFSIRDGSYALIENGFFSQAYSLFVVSYIAIPIFVLSKKRRGTSRNSAERSQLNYLIAGFSLFLGTNLLTNSVLPVFFGIYAFNAIGPIFSLFLAGAVFYIIWKHEFLDIRTAVQRGAIYSSLFALVVAAYAGVLLFVQRAFSLNAPVAAPVSAGFVTLVGIFTVPMIERYFKKWTDPIFFKDSYDYGEVLRSLSEALHRNAELDPMMRASESIFETVFHPESIELLASGRAALGPKRSGDRYTAEDARLLETFSHQAATAFERARLFQEVKAHALELERRVEERTAELRRAQENQEQMMIEISHNLQTPLTIFQTKLERLKRAAPHDAEIHAFENSIAGLSAFVYDLLKLSRLEHGERREVGDVDLSSVLSEIAEEISVIAASRGIMLMSAIAPGIHVAGDAQELREACMNLASNAVKYMRPQGKRLIRLSLAREGSAASLCVEDTGIGIREHDLPRVFERFYRARGAAAKEGSGLGLSIVESIVKNCGGSIRIESVFGEGTKALLSFPLSTSGLWHA